MYYLNNSVGLEFDMGFRKLKSSVSFAGFHSGGFMEDFFSLPFPPCRDYPHSLACNCLFSKSAMVSQVLLTLHDSDSFFYLPLLHLRPLVIRVGPPRLIKLLT